MFSAKDERPLDAATLWFNIAHYAMRPWPWILVALAVHLLYPNLADKETGYIVVLDGPPAASLRGLMIAAFAAAYMSTIATQLNWGASYLINDFLAPLREARRHERHYVRASQVRDGAAHAGLRESRATWIRSRRVEDPDRHRGGTGGVLLLRWYWWRINAWSEVAAMILRGVVSIGLQVVLGYDTDQPKQFALVMITTVAITTAVWLAVTYLTKPEPNEKLVSFYRRTRPSRAGWKPIAALAPEVHASSGGLANLIDWMPVACWCMARCSASASCCCTTPCPD
jgi:Na+/proline symporter